MINNKILILAVASILLVSAFTYIAKGAVTSIYSGSITLVDHAAPQPEFTSFAPESYSSTIYLPTANCEGVVTTCSFYFPTGVDAKYDATKDGRIDSSDLKALSGAYHCENTNSCNQMYTFTDCYFTYKNRRFKDPNGDCVLNKTDVDILAKYYNQNTPICDSGDLCGADLNKDGKIDLYDLTILAQKLGTNSQVYADEVNTYTVRKGDLDFNGNGKVDLSDLVSFAQVYGSVANEQRCDTQPMVHLDGNRYSVSATGRGIYHVAGSYFCAV
jgi:hypothetical protein